MQNLSLISFSINGHMKAQAYSSHEGKESSSSNIYPSENGFDFCKWMFYVKNPSCRPRVDPLPIVNFNNSQAEEFLTFRMFYMS